jgi:glycerol-3-phosphate dehydrogenase
VGTSSDLWTSRTTENIWAVELAGAGKNVYAIAAGISDGLGFENNTRAGVWGTLPSMDPLIIAHSNCSARLTNYRADNQISR